MNDIILAFFVAFMAMFLLELILSPLYFKMGYFKFFYHDIMGWHQPEGSYMHDGCSLHSTCRYCKKNIMQDSQGNWFTFE